jgi:trehalose 6-phosphate synthase/phosphatase
VWVREPVAGYKDTMTEESEPAGTSRHYERFGGLVIASNRLPVSLTLDGHEINVEPSSGGLVAALMGAERDSWIGWPGSVVPEELQPEAERLLAAERCRPVFLDATEEELFYGRICNDTLWPLFHYFVDRLRYSGEAWECYVEVNERFAETIAEHSPERALVWVHDFHLALVPEALRRRRPDVAIGYFLHIPFPSSEIYRLLPARSEILRGILGADYIGFHTGDYARHFRSSCLRVLGLESEPDTIEHGGRTVGIGVHPIGIDVDRFRETMHEPEAAAIEAELDERYGGKQLILGVERLDYTKGIPEKLDAFEHVLEQDPTRAESAVMLQVLVPSRLESPEYQAKLHEIEVRIAHINGRFGGLGGAPVEYVHRGISHAELAALYRRADVMMVTPLRDGMNLVAQEFVLCQTEEAAQPASRRGTLLLSEFAGAAQVLPGALLVNPWDAGDLAARLVDALALDPSERRRRLELMADRVTRLDCKRWATGFLKRLRRFAAAPEPRWARPLDRKGRERIGRRLAEARARTLFLDYDGTLRELASHPELAAPTPEIRELLADLASLPGTSVHLISGRKHETLETWFGDLPVHLGAEHGYLVRRAGGDWETSFDPDLSWLPRIHDLLERVTHDVPGTMVERKTAAVAWHYRQAEPEYGAWRARELLVALDQILAGASAEVLPGRHVVEVRARGANKGDYVRRLFPGEVDEDYVILAAGDDRTDVDLYRALPAGSIALHVGDLGPRLQNPSVRDQHTVASPKALRELLRSLAEELRSAGSAAQAISLR